MASVAVPEPQLLTVQPWDISQLGAVEKAIIAANLGLNPSNDGKIIRLSVPPLNEERRKQLAKQVHEIAEEHRIAVRNIRHQLERHSEENAQGQGNLRGRRNAGSKRFKNSPTPTSPRSTSSRRTRSTR